MRRNEAPARHRPTTAPGNSGRPSTIAGLTQVARPERRSRRRPVAAAAAIGQQPSHRRHAAIQRDAADDDERASSRCGRTPDAASTPSAIGRSNAAPTFRRSAGARLTVIRVRGKGKPGVSNRGPNPVAAFAHRRRPASPPSSGRASPRRRRPPRPRRAPLRCRRVRRRRSSQHATRGSKVRATRDRRRRARGSSDRVADSATRPMQRVDWRN